MMLRIEGETVDLSGVAAVDPALLRALQAAAAAGARYLRGASPEVYKALHVAGMAGQFERVAG
jgi:anti-anti-sigma regulatory factor